jgi:hypothetical protein
VDMNGDPPAPRRDRRCREPRASERRIDPGWHPEHPVAPRQRRPSVLLSRTRETLRSRSDRAGHFCICRFAAHTRSASARPRPAFVLRRNSTAARQESRFAREARSTVASAPRPNSARPVLARSLEVASIRAAAIPPAVALPVSDTWRRHASSTETTASPLNEKTPARTCRRGLRRHAPIPHAIDPASAFARGCRL